MLTSDPTSLYDVFVEIFSSVAENALYKLLLEMFLFNASEYIKAYVHGCFILFIGFILSFQALLQLLMPNTECR